MNLEVDAQQSASVSTDLRIAVLGNCQMGHVIRCLQAYLGGEWPTHEWILFSTLADIREGRRDLTGFFDRHDKVFMQPWIWANLEAGYQHMSQKVVLYPNFEFIAFHPDLVYISDVANGGFLAGPCGEYQSSLAFFAWKAGLTVTDALKLYNRDVYQRLGFFDFWEPACAALRAELRLTGLPEAMLDRWIERGTFMHSVNHPKLFVLADVVVHLLHRLGIPTLPGNPLQFVRDFLADSIVWPLYPEIAEHLGVPGDYLFKLSAFDLRPDQPVRMLDLEKFITLSFAAFSRHPPQQLVCSRIESPPYRLLLSDIERAKAGQCLVLPPAAATPRSCGRRVAHSEKPSVEVVDRAWLDESKQLYKSISAF